MLGEHVTWLRAISTGQRGGAAKETTSVALRKLLRIALCHRRLAVHRCGDLDRSQTTRQTFVGSFNLLNLVGIEKYDSRRFLHPTQNSRPAPDRSKLSPR